MEAGEFVVVQAEQVQQGDVQDADDMHARGGAESKLVRGTNNAGFTPPPAINTVMASAL